MGTYKCGKLYNLGLSELTPNPAQPRKVFSDAEIQVLADSIKEKGLLQPILVKELDDGQIIIVSGERRFRAHQILKRETIPAWFTTGDAEELALVENLVREDLSAIETAEALKQLSDKLDGKSQKDLARLIGKAETTVSEILSLNKLSEDIRNIARGDKRFALRELKKIATKRHPEKQRELFEKKLAQLESRPASRQTTGTDFHEKKLIAMYTYFQKLLLERNSLELSALYQPLINLKDLINIMLFSIRQLHPEFDASNDAKESSNLKMTDTLGSDKKKKMRGHDRTMDDYDF